MSGSVFTLRDVSRHRPGGEGEGQGGFSLRAPKLSIRAGSKVALVGASGCGKSTLLDMLAMVLKPDEASLFSFAPKGQAGIDVAKAWRSNKQNRLGRMRMRSIGYVLQTGGLFPFLTVRDNIAITRRGLGLPRQNKVEELAERLGIARYLDKKPDKLSVGERQRVAIARAMAHEPAVVLADEPTAALDPITADEIMELFTELVEEKAMTLVVATHDWEGVQAGGFTRVCFKLDRNSARGHVLATVVPDAQCPDAVNEEFDGYTEPEGEPESVPEQEPDREPDAASGEEPVEGQEAGA